MAKPIYPPGAAHEQASDQLAIDWAEPKHSILFEYPHSRLIPADEGRVARFLPPINASQRHYHEHHVDERNVRTNAAHLNEGENSFFLLNRFDVAKRTFRNQATAPRLAPKRPDGDGLDRLLHDVKAYELTVGTTKLRMMTSIPEDDRDDISKVAITVERHSYASAGNGDFSENTKVYTFPLARLEDDDLKPNPLVKSMEHILWRRSSRAVRHVVYWLGLSDMREGAIETLFLPSRKIQRQEFVPDLDALLDLISVNEVPIDTEAAERGEGVAPLQCGICTEPYTPDNKTPEDPHRPVRIRPCGHIYGDACIRHWWRTDNSNGDDGLAIPRCPWRCKTLDPSRVRRREQNGTYHNLPQFSAYENFEISCADLDGETPVREVENKSVVIRPEVIDHALDLFENGALLEDPESTPYNLQTIRFAETQRAVDLISTFADTNKGMKLTYKQLATYLDLSIADELIADMARNSIMKKFLTEDERDNMTPTIWANYLEAPLRPGWFKFVRRLIHRVIMFLAIRSCVCEPGFHKHGARTFWNPNNFEVEEVDAEELHGEMQDLAKQGVDED